MQLAGRKLTLNQVSPDFTVLNNAMEEVRLFQFKHGIKVIASLASLDTPVCESQITKFNKEAVNFFPETMVIVVSKDLPFAQKRFCVDHNINNLLILSDYKYSSFGINYGLLIKELNLLARAVVILDNNNIVKYIQIAEELTNQLDYPDILKNLSEVVKTKSLPKNKDLLVEKCKPCEIGALPLSIDVINDYLQSFPDWQLIENKKIVKEIKFTDFVTAKYFLDLLAVIAEEQGHHPVFTLVYNKLKITLTTHAANGLTKNDFIMAKIIDELKT